MVFQPCPKPAPRVKTPKPLQRGKRINPRNQPRTHQRFRRAYLDPAFVALVRWKGCVVPGCHTTPVQACHRKSRGAGGTWMDIFGACHEHHDIQHRIGVTAFEKRFRLDLEAECAANVTEWQVMTKDAT